MRIHLLTTRCRAATSFTASRAASRSTTRKWPRHINAIEDAVMQALNVTPAELSADIYKTGIYLAGGGSLLRGLDKRISKITQLPVHVVEDPLRAVARGTAIALKNLDKFESLTKY